MLSNLLGLGWIVRKITDVDNGIVSINHITLLPARQSSPSICYNVDKGTIGATLRPAMRNKLPRLQLGGC